MDAYLDRFLRRQQVEGMELAAASEVLELLPLGGAACRRYVVQLHCKTLVSDGDGEIREWPGLVVVGVRFQADHLRSVDPLGVVSVLEPLNIWHPNVRGPFICVGRIAPGTGLVDLIYQSFEIVTFHKVTPREDDCLNPAACGWARQSSHLFPVNRRPLKRAASASGAWRAAGEAAP